MTPRHLSDNAKMMEALSALADGQANEAQMQQVLAAWPNDPLVRAEWWTYHMVGDAIRSDMPLASLSSDEAFLARLTERLVSEPVVLAPAAMSAGKATTGHALSHQWAWPLAMAVSVMALVAGLLGVLQEGSTSFNDSTASVARQVNSVSNAPFANRQLIQTYSHVKPWPVDAAWTAAMNDGASQISFRTSETSEVFRPKAAAISMGHDGPTRVQQLDTFWAQAQ